MVMGTLRTSSTRLSSSIPLFAAAIAGSICLPGCGAAAGASGSSPASSEPMEYGESKLSIVDVR